MNLNRTLLITGGLGYIGSVLSRTALTAGYRINILDSASMENHQDQKTLTSPGVAYFQGSISDSDVLKSCLRGVNYVVHLAGVSDGKAGKANPELTKKINIDTLEELLQISKAAGVERFIFASTMGVYGNQYTIPLDENLPLNPVDPYSLSKALGEDIIRRHHSENFTTTILRMAMVYGVSPNMRFDFILNQLTLNAIRNKQLTLLGGDQKRPQIHIDDLCNLFVFLMSLNKEIVGNEAFNAVGENPSIKDIAIEIQKLIPDLSIELLPKRESEDSFEMNGNKLTKKTGFKFQKNIGIGISEIINQYYETLK